MICPSCSNKVSRLKAMNKAKEKRLAGYICFDCDAHLKDKGWPKKTNRKLLLLYGCLGVVSIPLITYLEVVNRSLSYWIGALTVALFFGLPFFLKPKNTPWFSYELFK